MTKATITIQVFKKYGRSDVYAVQGQVRAAKEAIVENWDLAHSIPIDIEYDGPSLTREEEREAELELAIKYAKLGSLRRQKEALEKEIRALAFDLR